MRAILAQRDRDPKQEILDAVAPYLDEIEPLGAQMLVAVYVRPAKTASGLYLPDKTRQEDVYQGKVGLILKVGPLAFVDDDRHVFGPQVPQVGDWVMFRIGDTFQFVLGDVQCRFVEDVSVKGRVVSNPDVVM